MRVMSKLALLAVVGLGAAGCAGAEESEGAGAPTQTGGERERNGMLPVVRGTPIDVSALDGTIVFDDFEDVFVKAAAGGDERTVAGRRGPEFDGAWSPDGRWIVYRDSRRGINENDELFVVRADGRGPRNLTRSGANDWGADWAPDGRRIVFNSDRGGTLRGYLVAPDGSDLTPVPTDVWFEYPSFSPDGSRIAFMGHAGKGYDVYTVDLDRGTTTKLTDAPGDDGFPAWSPDGTTIAFTSERDDCDNVPEPAPCSVDPEGDPGEFRSVWLMDADGANERRVTPEFGQFVAWAPDGTSLLVSGASLYVVRLDGTGRADVVPGGGGIPDWVAAGE